MCSPFLPQISLIRSGYKCTAKAAPLIDILGANWENPFLIINTDLFFTSTIHFPLDMRPSPNLTHYPRFDPVLRRIPYNALVWNTSQLTLFFFIRILFSRARLNILIFPPILGCKYSCIILNNSL